MNLLSIDGGGIKGLYSIVVLDQIEKKFNIEIAKHVNIISGTSIGGIIALAIAAKKTPSEIIDFFWGHGAQIFPSNFLQRGWKSIISFVWSRNSNKNLIVTLKDFFGEDTRLGDIKDMAVCIPSVNLRTGKAKVFKTPHHNEIYLDAEYRIWEVALATSAAPYYLPIAEISSPKSRNIKEYYVDGGLWGNNPSLVAVTEALTYSKTTSCLNDIDINIGDLNLLSIGNISSGMGSIPCATNKGLLPWNKKLILLPLSSQSDSTSNITRLLFKHNGGKYLRIEHQGNTIPKEFELDRADRKTMETIEELALNDTLIFNSQPAETFFKNFFTQGDS